MNLSDLGYDQFCNGGHRTWHNDDYAPARVVGVRRDSCLIHDGSRQIRAELTGRMMFGLMGGGGLSTRAVRQRDGKGRHTTSSRELFILDNGAMIIDTPGMRELGSLETQQGLAETFEDMDHFAADCRFNDCSHTVEKGCAVLAALQTGKIDEKRYENYLPIGREIVYNQMSMAEKRKKDKQFGKMCKNVMEKNPPK